MNAAPHLSVVPAPMTSDGALCRAFLDGDTRAFGELVRRYQKPVFGLVRRYAKTDDDARDLVQRAMLQAFEAAERALPKLTPNDDDDVPFRAWLFRIAINLGKNASRDGRRWQLVPVDALDAAPSGVPGAIDGLLGAEQRARVRAAVSALTEKQREVFTLRIDAGLPFAEIAEVLEMSEVNAKVHFHHAVKRLREEVSKGEES